jgi:hypothetical protein
MGVFVHLVLSVVVRIAGDFVSYYLNKWLDGRKK